MTTRQLWYQRSAKSVKRSTKMEKLKFRIYAQANKPHQVSAAKSFAEGVDKHGHFVTWDNSPADVFVSWGLRSPFRNIGKPWVCLAAGYINGTGGSYTD